MSINFYSKRILKLLSLVFFLSFTLSGFNRINKQTKAEKNLVAATEKDIFYIDKWGHLIFV